MNNLIVDHRVSRFEFPRTRVVGDWRVRADTNHVGTLEIFAADGNVGLGFFGSLVQPLPTAADLDLTFRAEVAAQIYGHDPAVLINRYANSLGDRRSTLFAQALDQALWDLSAKQFQMPLYKLLGGTTTRAKGYASALDFHLSTDELLKFVADVSGRGFSAYKIKVGHPSVRWEIDRLRQVVALVGEDATLMVDANEAWSPKEAIRRAFAYRDAGIRIDWIEDPCRSDDFEGTRQVANVVPFTRVNAGEYLDVRQKAHLLANRATDILHVHGHISDALLASRMALLHDIPVSIGNTPLDLGVHLAVAIPGVEFIECSFPDGEFLVIDPIEIREGHVIAPDRPGHGLVLSEDARKEYQRPS